MDAQFVSALEQLLEQVSTPDSAVIKAATAKLSDEFYTQQASLPALVLILQNSQNQQTRFLAAVEARKLVRTHWESLDESTQAHVKETVLKVAFSEPAQNIRHQVARIIAAIGEFEFDQGKWTEIFPLLLSASTDDSSVQNKETAVFILYTVLEAGVSEMGNNINSFIEHFTKTAQDQSSLDVRVYSVLSLGVCAGIAESYLDEQPQIAQTVQNIIPVMVEVLKEVITSADPVHGKKIFNSFNDLLLLDGNLLGDNLVALVQIMMEIGINTQVDEDIRIYAIQFLSSAATFRKNKISSKKLGRDITLAALKIASGEVDVEAELDQEDDDNENEESDPSSLALRLISLAAMELPPSQIVNTIFEQLPSLLASQNQFERRAGLLAIGCAVYGAPEYYSTHLEKIVNAIVAGLKDSELLVRVSALRSLAQLINELKGELSNYHDTLLPLVIDIIDSATHATVYKNGCICLDSLIEYMSNEGIAKYLEPLMNKLFHMLQVTDSSKLRAIIVSAIGSTAYAAGSLFIPYFAKSVQALEPFIQGAVDTEGISEDDLELRALTLENISTMARAVKSETFAQFAQPLIDAAYASIQSDSSRLRESGFTLIYNMAKVYKKDFAPFLDNIMPQIYECLNQDEFNIDADALEGGVGDDDDDMNEKFQVHTGITVEKEVAAIALSELALGTQELFLPHVEKSVNVLLEQAKDSYGMRETALTSLWKVVEAVLSTELKEKSYPKGAPSGSYVSDSVLSLIKTAREVSIDSLSEEYEFNMVAAILESISDLVTKFGAIIVMDNGDSTQLEKLCGELVTILKGEHICQTLDDDELPDDEEVDSSETDAILFDNTLEVLVSLSTALGGDFNKILDAIKDIIIGAVNSKDKTKKASALGCLGEICFGLKEANTNTELFLQLLMDRLQHDKSAEVRGFAAYGIGGLIYYAQQDYSSLYPTVFNALAKLLTKVQKQEANVAVDDEESQESINRSYANACGCVARLALKHQNATPLSAVLPSLFEHLPLETAFEENTPVFELLIKLYQSGNEDIVPYTPKVIELLAHVFSKQEAIEKLEVESTLGREQHIDSLKHFESEEVKQSVVELVKFLESKYPGTASQNAVLAKYLA